jgi:hypothetical protein
MSFHVRPAPDNEPAFWDGSFCALVTPLDEAPEIGDIVRFDDNDETREYTSRFRQVVRHFRFSTDQSYVSMLIAPIELPLMRQVELFTPLFGFQVYWIASDKPIHPGSTLRMGADNLLWGVVRSFTSLPLHAVPLLARVAFASELNLKPLSVN